jgi:amino acid permease
VPRHTCRKTPREVKIIMIIIMIIIIIIIIIITSQNSRQKHSERWLQDAGEGTWSGWMEKFVQQHKVMVGPEG